MVGRRPARPPAVLHVRPASPPRPRQRHGAVRRDRRLRDVGDAGPAGDERRAAVPRLDGRQPRDRPRRAGSSGAGLVGGDGRARTSHRHQPLVRRVRQRPRWVSRFDGSGVAAPGRRPAVRVEVPGRHDPRHGAGPGPPRRRPRHHGLARRRRRLDGWDAGPGVGDHVPASGPLHRADRDLHAGHRPADRLGRHREAGDRARPALARRRVLRGRATDPTRAWRSPAWSPRSRSAATTCSPTGSGGTSSTARGTATRSVCGSSSRSRRTSTTTAPSSCADSTPTATWSSAKRWTSTTSCAAGAAWPVRWAGSPPPASPSASRQISCTRTTSSARSTRSCGPRESSSRYVEIDSPHGHDAFLINVDQLADPIAEFLDQVSER